jgi:hypothetical protein
MKHRKIIGYWYSTFEPQYPMPIANNVPFPNKINIIKALQAKEAVAQKKFAKGWSTCRICKKSNGSVEYESGNYTWPEGYLHYLEDHNVVPDSEFVKWLLPKMNAT